MGSRIVALMPLPAGSVPGTICNLAIGNTFSLESVWSDSELIVYWFLRNGAILDAIGLRSR